MLKSRNTQFKFQMVLLEDLVPKNHLLRKIDKYIDFSFIDELTRDLYCSDNGRPALDPIVLFKMLFVGYIFGIRSERRLVQEIEVNIAYRWFVGFDLDDKIPDHSVFSQNRRRRFSKKPELEQKIFDNIVSQAVKHGLIDGHYLYSDSTHIKANANKNKFVPVTVEQTPMEYLDELNKEVDKQRKAIGKKPLHRDNDDEGGSSSSSGGKTREIKQSTTDPDSGFMTRDGKPKGFFYLDHRTVDGKYGLIVDSHVTPGNINDARPYPSRIRRILERFCFDVWAVGLDAGYTTPNIARVLSDLCIYGVTGYKRKPHQHPGRFYPRQFIYDAATDSVTCPEGKKLHLCTVDRNGYRVYRAQSSDCGQCPSKARCTECKARLVLRHVWQGLLDEMDSHRHTDKGKKIYKRRKETVERSFADAKEMHGLRYARFRGIARVRAQCLLTAACQNMKKMALVLARKDAGSFFVVFRDLWACFQRFWEGLSVSGTVLATRPA